MVSDDPFADDDPGNVSAAYKQAVKNVLKGTERGTFVETTLANNEPIQGEIVPYTRIVDLSEDLQLVPLVDLQGQDLCVWRYDRHEGDPDMGPFLTMEVSFLSDQGQNHFLVNCGGQDVIRKIESAFKAVSENKAMLPLVASFTKRKLNSGFSFWQMT